MIWEVYPYWREARHAAFRTALWTPGARRTVTTVGDRTHRGGPIEVELEALGDALRGSQWQLIVATLDVDGDWGREAQQRDAAGPWLRDNTEPDDLCLIVDADEIVDPQAVPHILDATARGPVKLGMALYYYGLRWRAATPWMHPYACRARDLPDSLTAMRLDMGRPVVPDAGWHLAWQGSDTWVDQKLSAFAHAEFDTPEHRDSIARGRLVGIDPHGNRLLDHPLNEQIARLW